MGRINLISITESQSSQINEIFPQCTADKCVSFDVVKWDLSNRFFSKINEENKLSRMKADPLDLITDYMLGN